MFRISAAAALAAAVFGLVDWRFPVADDEGGLRALQALAWISAWWALFGLGVGVCLQRGVIERGARMRQLLKGARAPLACLTLVACGACYLLLMTGAVAYGDAAIYNSQIESGRLGERAIHWGYYVYGAPFVGVLPFHTDLAMNVACAIAGLVGVALLFELVHHEVEDAWLACVVAAGTGLCAVYVYASVYSGYFILQAMASLAAIALWRRSRSVASGVAFGYSLTVSVVGFALAPLYLFPAVRLRRLVGAVVGALLAYGFFLAFHWESLLWGDRGLMKSGAVWYGEPILLLKGWLASAAELLGAFPIFLPLSVAALVLLRRHPSGLRFRWIAPIALALGLHAFLGGVATPWLYDLFLYPLLFVPLVAWCRRQSHPAAEASEHDGVAFVVLTLALVFNTACSLSLHLPTPLFREPPLLRDAYREVGSQVGDAVPLGSYAEMGLYLRANDRPYALPLPRFTADAPGEYVVLDDQRLELVERGGGSVRVVREFAIAGRAIRHVRYRPPDSEPASNPR